MLSGAILACTLLTGCNDIIGLTPGTQRGEGGTSTTGGEGGTGGTPIACVPSEQSAPVENGCGVFVSASTGSDVNPGSKESPLASVGAAAKIAKGKPLYLCAEELDGAVTISDSASMFGGLDCNNDWQYVGNTTRTKLTAPADTIPLRITTAAKLHLYDIAITASDAATPGGSSTAVIAEGGSELSLTRCGLEAGNGSEGLDGMGYSGSATDGVAAGNGTDACGSAQTVGADPPLIICGNGSEDVSYGGNGGVAYASDANPGTAGSPLLNDNGGDGDNGGINAACTAGTIGANGSNGDAGLGAGGLGNLGAMGYTGKEGMDGKPGMLGQGGGGGGGSRGGTGADKCPSGGPSGGASGAPGGSGGCGGAPGKGGKPGGASIGILSVGAVLVFSDVIITARNGGTGGEGGRGEGGGAGAKGGIGGKVPAGSALKPGCSGATGGKGGDGGWGGGGLGGHSIGIAYTGAAPKTDGANIFLGKAGEGGIGDGVTETSKGAKGIAKETQAF
jgi:hypothetical protein